MACSVIGKPIEFFVGVNGTQMAAAKIYSANNTNLGLLIDLLMV
jgi:hypothetical protein